MSAKGDAEVDRSLVQANVLAIDASPNLLEAVKTSTHDTIDTEGMTPQREATAECGSEGTLAMTPVI